MICPHSATPSSAGAKFCAQCAHALQAPVPASSSPPSLERQEEAEHRFVLHNLLVYALTQAQLPASVLRRIACDLVAIGSGQQSEVETKRWSAARFQEVGTGIAGRQWSAYFQILLHGTRLAPRVAALGMQVGIVIHVAEDVRSHDPRYTSLPAKDKRKVIAWAEKAARILRKEDLACFDALLRGAEPVWTRARAA